MLDIFMSGKQENCEPVVLSELLATGDTYVDIGANCGWYCRIISSLKPESNILAIEPGDLSYLSLARLTSPKLIPLKLCVSARAGKMHKTNSSFRMESGHFYDYSPTLPQSHHNFDYGVESISVDEATKLFNEFIGNSFVMKIDVEGRELDVLMSSSNSLNRVKAILLEINDRKITNNCLYEPSQIYHFLIEHGFSHFYDVQNCSNQVHSVDPLTYLTGSILATRSAISCLDYVDVCF